jgi:long-chain fatty acid transport protein
MPARVKITQTVVVSANGTSRTAGRLAQPYEVTMSRSFKLMALFACFVFAPAMARAQGHMLHGVGPVNSAMGGAGAALPEDSLDALTFNPALLTAARGNQISFTTEFFKDGINIKTTVGSISGEAHPSNQMGVIPAFGWQLRDPSKKMSLGFGLIGLAGFRTDYPQDNGSILFAIPPIGFGRIYTDYRETKIPVAMAFQLTPKLAVGASLNVYLGEFAVAPLPYKVFDTDPVGERWYPEAGSLNTSWALGGQFGFLYDWKPKVSFGGSYTTAQNFKQYHWNATIADPTSRAFGTARTLTFDLDGPMSATLGIGLKLNAKTSIAVDTMFTKYKGVDGFGSPGGIVDGIVYPFGWRNIWTFKTGVQRQMSDKIVLRAGYNYSQMPLQSDKVLTATGAPATFQHHITGGFGFKMFPFLEAEASFYFVPRQHLVGPFPDLDNNVKGTLDESNKLTSGLIGLNFHF